MPFSEEEWSNIEDLVFAYTEADADPSLAPAARAGIKDEAAALVVLELGPVPASEVLDELGVAHVGLRRRLELAQRLAWDAQSGASSGEFDRGGLRRLRVLSDVEAFADRISRNPMRQLPVDGVAGQLAGAWACDEPGDDLELCREVRASALALLAERQGIVPDRSSWAFGIGFVGALRRRLGRLN